MFVLQQEHHVTEKKEEHPTAMNAFELISMSKGLNLGNLFEIEQVHTRSFCSIPLLDDVTECILNLLL